jgi:hypothetical protein
MKELLLFRQVTRVCEGEGLAIKAPDSAASYLNERSLKSNLYWLDYLEKPVRGLKAAWNKDYR